MDLAMRAIVPAERNILVWNYLKTGNLEFNLPT
jgi:hypothetical protein